MPCMENAGVVKCSKHGPFKCFALGTSTCVVALRVVNGGQGPVPKTGNVDL